MDKPTSIIAAFDAGKLSSTQQLNAFIEWLLVTVLPTNRDNLSEPGQALVGNLRQILEAHKVLNENKNADNLAQETLWHLSQGEVNNAVRANVDLGDKKHEVSSDQQSTQDSLRTLVSLFWESVVSEGNFLLGDFASLARLSLADAAEVVQDQAGRTKEGLRRVDQEVEEGKRDAFGRDKERLEAEGDKQVKFENRMDLVKDVGSRGIGAGQSVSGKPQEMTQQTKDRLSGSYRNALRRAQEDPAYHDHLTVLFDTLHKWVARALDSSRSQRLDLDTLIDDPSPDQHIHHALTGIKTLLDRFASPQSSVDAVMEKAQIFVSSLRGEESKRVQAWVDKYFTFAHRMLDSADYAQSEESQRVSDELGQEWRTLMHADSEIGHSWTELSTVAQAFGNAVANDEDVRRLQETHAKLAKDLAQGIVGGQSGMGMQAMVDSAVWFWRDLFSAYAPRLFSMLKDIPIPRTEYADNEMELVLENMDISSFELNPAHISVRSTTDMDVRTSPDGPNQTKLGLSTHIHLQAVQLALKDVSFWYRDNESGALVPSQVHGLLGMEMPPEGIDIELKFALIPSARDRESKQRYHEIEVSKVNISDKIKLSLRESNHRLLLALAKPMFKKRFREAFSRALSQQLRMGFETLDGIAWDVSRRADVFTDSGMGRGAAYVSAIWSEIGRMVRGRKMGLRLTGTGFVLDGPETDKKFAMGAEPQVLSGDKHGPLATASQPLESRGERRDQNESVDAQSAVQEGKNRVLSFKQRVDEKSSLESQNSGWQSSAFDI